MPRIVVERLAFFPVGFPTTKTAEGKSLPQERAATFPGAEWTKTPEVPQKKHLTKTPKKPLAGSVTKIPSPTAS